MTAGDPPTEPVAPDWRELRALWPLLLLDFGILFILRWHFEAFWEWLIANVALLVGLAVWNFLPEKTIEGAKLALARLLTRRDLARGLYGAVALVLILSFFASSMHVVAKEAPATQVTLYWIEPTDSGDVVVGEKLLDAVRDHQDFFVPLWPTGRKVSLATSTHLRTATMSLYPWSAPFVAYPGSFHSLVSVALLPTPDFLTAAGGDPLMVRISEATGARRTLALDTLTDGWHLRALILSFVSPQPPNAETRQRWIAVIQTAAEDPDTMAAVPIVNGWMKYRPTRARRDLVIGDSLRIAIFKPPAETLATRSVRLDSAFSDVLMLRERQ